MHLKTNPRYKDFPFIKNMPKIWNNLDDTGTLPQRPTTPRRAAHRAPHRNAPHRNATQRNAPQCNAPHRTAPHRTTPRRVLTQRPTLYLQPTPAVPDGSSDGEEAKKAPELTPDQLKVFDTLTSQYMSKLEEAGLDKALGLDTQALKVKLGY